jgi:hypothetical protein
LKTWDWTPAFAGETIKGLFLFVIPAEAGIQENLRSNQGLFNDGLLRKLLLKYLTPVPFLFKIEEKE